MPRRKAKRKQEFHTHRDPRLPAAVDLLGRTGAQEFQLRFSPEDEPPITWTALARWNPDKWECAASMDPLKAVFRLCDEVINGGQCTHCKKPAGFEESIDPTPLNQFVCWYQWDPELKTFRRGCE